MHRVYKEHMRVMNQEQRLKVWTMLQRDYARITKGLRTRQFFFTVEFLYGSFPSVRRWIELMEAVYCNYAIYNDEVAFTDASKAFRELVRELVTDGNVGFAIVGVDDRVLLRDVKEGWTDHQDEGTDEDEDEEDEYVSPVYIHPESTSYDDIRKMWEELKHRYGFNYSWDTGGTDG